MDKNYLRKLRIQYTIFFCAFLLIEIIIALFIRDKFIRPYLGDVLAVVVLYCGIRIIIPYKYIFMPFYVFLAAAFVECLQYFRLIELLNLQDNIFLRIILGMTFDWIDIVCYGIGCILLGIYEVCYRK